MRNRTGPYWVVLVVVAVGAIGAVGCQRRVKVTRTVTLEAGQSHLFLIDAPGHDQSLTVSVDPNGPAEVFVYLKKDEAAVEQAVETGRPPPALLASWKGSAAGAVQATIPAKEEAVVRVESMQKTIAVTVNIVGK